MNLSVLEQRLSLGFFPTPLEPLARLSRELGGPDILIKRDDQTGLALGGNKTRKLEYILADAQEQGADTIVTAGAAQSNHCRQTAAAAARLGMECHLVLGGQAPEVADGNLLLDQLLGAQIHWAGEHRKGEDIPALLDALIAQGKRPYAVPYGGSNTLGALAFVNAMRELKAQTENSDISHIVFASSSGGTHAGMMVGKRVFGMECEIIGINIDKAAMGNQAFAGHVIDLAAQTAQLLGLEPVFDDELILDNDYLGEGYGIVNEADNEAIRLMARHEGILLDPVYTGRAMAGLIGRVRKGLIPRDARVLFWHTGGAPALFAYGDQLHV